MKGVVVKPHELPIPPRTLEGLFAENLPHGVRRPAREVRQGVVKTVIVFRHGQELHADVASILLQKAGGDNKVQICGKKVQLSSNERPSYAASAEHPQACPLWTYAWPIHRSGQGLEIPKGLALGRTKRNRPNEKTSLRESCCLGARRMLEHNVVQQSRFLWEQPARLADRVPINWEALDGGRALLPNLLLQPGDKVLTGAGATQTQLNLIFEACLGVPAELPSELVYEAAALLQISDQKLRAGVKHGIDGSHWIRDWRTGRRFDSDKVQNC